MGARDRARVDLEAARPQGAGDEAAVRKDDHAAGVEEHRRGSAIRGAHPAREVAPTSAP